METILLNCEQKIYKSRILVSTKTIWKALLHWANKNQLQVWQKFSPFIAFMIFIYYSYLPQYRYSLQYITEKVPFIVFTKYLSIILDYVMILHRYKSLGPRFMTFLHCYYRSFVLSSWGNEDGQLLKTAATRVF